MPVNRAYWVTAVLALSLTAAAAQPAPRQQGVDGIPGRPPPGVASPAPPAQPAGATPYRFRTEQDLGEWRGSTLIGLDVLGANGETLADVREILVTEDGRLTAVVLGVGGLLGVGERLVAVPFGALEIAVRSIAATRNPAANPEQSRTGRDPDVTGSPPGSTNSTRDAFVTRGGEPTHLILRIDRETLEAAPRFRYVGRGTTAGPEPVDEPGSPGMTGPPPAAPPLGQPRPR